jgi:taurine dioxygenase
VFRERKRRNGATAEELAQFDRDYPNPVHPVIRTHPETGRKAIYVNAAFTKEIVGMDPAESAELLQILYDQAKFPEYQVRFHWEPNSIVFWDNRSCQHYATSDYWPAVRRVERVTVIGDVPYFDPEQAPQHLPTRPFKGALARWAAS